MPWLLKIKNSHWQYQLLVGLLSLELMSVLAWRWQYLNIVFLASIAVLLIYCLWRQPQVAALLVLAELTVGVMGRSLSFHLLSLRLVIFIIIFLYAVLYWFWHKPQLKIKQHKVLWNLYIIWLAIILLGVLNAYWHHIDFYKIFFDANAYLYWLYLPIAYQFYDSSYWPKLLNAIGLIAIYIATKTLIIFSIFSQFNDQWLDIFYKWLRDTRWAEITPLGNNFYRVFSQSQIFVLLVFLSLWLKQITDFKNYKNLLLIIILATALLLSLSRSFWLGGAIAFVLMLILARFNFVFSIRLLFKQIFIVFVISMSLSMLLYNVPKFNGDSIFQFSHSQSAAQSASSRQALWSPLLQAIKSEPILGYGFGKEISYYSSDPRIKNENNPSGEYSTYALEWGWLEFALKFGLVGLIFISFCLALVLWRSYVIIKQSLNNIFILASIVALSCVHFFSPYLNHPLGIGWLIIVIVYLYQGTLSKDLSKVNSF